MHIESECLKIFISHSWIDSDQYNELVDILNSSCYPWKNLSISRQEALLIYDKGEDAYSQEVELQEKRLNILRKKKNALRSRIDEYNQEFNKEVTESENKINKLEKCYKFETDKKNKEIEKVFEKSKIEIRKLEKYKMNIKDNIAYLEKFLDPVLSKRLIVESESRLYKMIENGDGKRFIEAEKKYLLSLKENVEMNVVLKKIKEQKHLLKTILTDQRLIKINADNSILLLKNSIRKHEKKITNSIEKIKNEIKILRNLYNKKIDKINQGNELINLNSEETQCQDRIDKLRNDWNNSNKYNIFTHEDGIFPYRKANSETVRLNPTLSLSLYNKILESDIFLVLGQAFRQYKLWMDFEFKTALSLGKKIICVIPSDRDSLPPELRHFCETAVSWNKISILDSIFV